MTRMVDTASPGSASSLLRAALDAVRYAEAWPHNVDAQQRALTLLSEASSAGMVALSTALTHAAARPVERLTLAQLANLRGPGGLRDRWYCSSEVGQILAERVRRADYFPKLLWRVAWIPRYDGSLEGCVVAWDANHVRTKQIDLGAIPIAGDKECYTPFETSYEIQFRLGNRLIDRMVLATSCTYGEVPALHIEAFGAGDIAYARRAGANCGEAMWRKYAIPGLHHTWEEVMAAGGPSREAR